MWVAGEMAPGIKCFLCKPQMVVYMCYSRAGGAETGQLL